MVYRVSTLTSEGPLFLWGLSHNSPDPYHCRVTMWWHSYSEEGCTHTVENKFSWCGCFWFRCQFRYEGADA